MNKLKFNIFDTIIIILVIASFFGSAFYTYSRQISMMFVKSKNAVITITFQSDEKQSSNTLSDNGYLYLSEEDSKFGNILSVVNRRNINDTPSSEETDPSFAGNDNFTIVVRIGTKIKETENGRFVNSYTFVAPGKNVSISTKLGDINCIVEKILVN